jgi:ATP:corrinoid adenosyltransferase BtuR/CobO/CobP
VHFVCSFFAHHCFVVALCYEGETQYRYLVASDLSWRYTDIAQVFTLRWLIEVFFEDWKAHNGWDNLTRHQGEDGSNVSRSKPSLPLWRKSSHQKTQGKSWIGLLKHLSNRCPPDHPRSTWQGLTWGGRSPHPHCVAAPQYDMLHNRVKHRYLDLSKVIHALRRRRRDLHVVMTGRYASLELIDFADLATEMRDAKHENPNKPLPPQPGIVF